MKELAFFFPETAERSSTIGPPEWTKSSFHVWNSHRFRKLQHHVIKVQTSQEEYYNFTMGHLIESKRFQTYLWWFRKSTPNKKQIVWFHRGKTRWWFAHIFYFDPPGNMMQKVYEHFCNLGGIIYHPLDNMSHHFLWWTSIPTRWIWEFFDF